MRANRNRIVIGLTGVALALAACSGGAGAGAEAADINQVRLAMDGAHFMNVAPPVIATERTWPDAGFTEDLDLILTSEIIPAVLTDQVWIGQIETQPLWAALNSGGADELVVVGVKKGYELWTLGVGPDIKTAEDLKGKRVTGGPPGERNVTVMETMIEEVGLSLDDVEFVTVDGGSDEYFRALVAGQIDAAPIRTRHLAELENIGGQVLFSEVVTAPQEVWVAKRSFVESNPEAIRAFLQGVIEAKRWAAAGEDQNENREEAFEITQNAGYEPGAGEFETWGNFIDENWSLTGGATAEAFDQWTEDMIDIGIVSDGFDWRAHVDFEPLWAAQSELGIELEPSREATER